MDTWASIKNGREALGDYLGGLSADEWNRPSLCAGWTVRDVGAHLSIAATQYSGTKIYFDPDGNAGPSGSTLLVALDNFSPAQLQMGADWWFA